MRVPRGGYAIIVERNLGKKPSLPVIVSCVGPLLMENPVVRLEPGADEWGFLEDLEVVVYVRPGVQVAEYTMRGIAKLARTLDIWDVERKQGQGLVAKWRADGRFDRWLKFRWAQVDCRAWAH